MENRNKILQVEKVVDVRFSEVDSMGIVWHGNYVLYFEDARELRGINMTISAACASGSHAIGLGLMFIRNGLQDMIICGGAQETHYLSMGSFDGIGAFSIRVDDPTKASRPFDRDRDGLVPGGGAAAVILEDYDHAVKRGAHIIAEVAGYGFSSNGANISQPSDTKHPISR